jgi:hypothetical protein
MPPARTAALRREIDRAFPSRPFAIEFWDGTRLPETDGGGPTAGADASGPCRAAGLRARPSP